MLIRGRERQQDKEKGVRCILKLPEVMNLHLCRFSAMSATVKLTGPERSGEVLPIVLWFAERLQQSDTKKKKRKKHA